MSSLNKNVLVLNKGYKAISVVSVLDAISSVYTGKSVFVDTDYIEYKWNDWADKKLVDLDTAHKYPDSHIKMGWYGIQVPQVMILKNYSKVPQQSVRLTRRNLYIRDGGRCCYTGKRLKTSEITIDHVIPRCKGGKNTWQNLVISSLAANTKKGGRTPQQADMKLLKTPSLPKWNPIYITGIRNCPQSWKNFLNTQNWDECYWDVQLAD